MLNFRVKEEFTKEDKQILSDNGFILHTGTPYKAFGENRCFQIILNPCFKGGLYKVVMGYCDEVIKIGLIDKSIDIFEVWETINMLIANEIISIVKDGE